MPTLDWALRLTTTVVVPAAVGLLMLSGPLMATFFGYGAFTDHHVLMSSYALMAYSMGLIGFSMVKVLAPGYFARQDTRTPVRIGLIALSFNMAFNICVVVPAFLMDFPVPHVLLAVSTGLSAIINSTLLYRGLRRDGIYRPSPAWGKLLPAGRAREPRHGRLPLVGFGRLVGLDRLVGRAPRRLAGPLGRRRGGGLLRRARPVRYAPQGPEASIIAGHDFPIRQGHADSTWFQALS